MSIHKQIIDCSQQNIFWDNFWPNFVSDAISTLILGGIVGLALYLLQSRLDKKGDQKLKEEKLALAIDLLFGEINHNRGQLKRMLREFNKLNLPYPALEVGVWEMLDKGLILDGLEKSNVQDIINIYARTMTINTIYDELIKNSSWMLDKPKPKIKREFFRMLTDRCQELLSYMNETIPEVR